MFALTAGDTVRSRPVPAAGAAAERRRGAARRNRRLRHALAEQQSRTEAEAQAREAEPRARETAEQRAAREAEERAVWEALAAEQEAANVALAGQLRDLREQAEAARAQRPAALLQQSERAAEAIELDEADTRLIVDAKLRAMGWQADTNRLRHALGTRPDPSGAVAIAEWPTESGPVDYALFIKGRCVGVIEAKKLGTDVPAVLEQTKRYARGIRLAPDETLAESPWQHGPGCRLPRAVRLRDQRPAVREAARDQIGYLVLGCAAGDERGDGAAGMVQPAGHRREACSRTSTPIGMGSPRSRSIIPGCGPISVTRSRRSRKRLRTAAATFWSPWPPARARRGRASR